MPFSSVVNNAVSTMTGEVEKAILAFRDMRYLTAADIDKVQMQVKNKQTPAGLGSPKSLGSVAPSNIAGAIMEGVSSVTGVKPKTNKYYNKFIEVQFNPTSIHLSGHAGDDDVSITNFNQSGKPGIGNGAMDLQMEMSVDLIFDQTNNMFAFKQDLLDMGLSDGANEVAKNLGSAAVSAITGQKQVSVQQTVEAFIALMRFETTRFVCFQWGDLKYEGTMRRLNSEYTMFDMLGNPTRAKVRMTIYLVEITEEQLKDYTNGYWYNAYYEAFIMGNPLAESMAGITDLGSV